MAEWHWGIGVKAGPLWLGRSERARRRKSVTYWMLYPMAVCWVLSVAYPSVWYVLWNLLGFWLLCLFGLHRYHIRPTIRKATRWLQK